MRVLAVVAVLIVVLAASALGQWRVGVEIATTRYNGSARDTSNGSGPPNFRPGDATTIGLRMERIVGALAAVVRLSYGKPGLAVGSGELIVQDRTSGELIEAATLVAFRVGGIGPSGAVRAEIGPALHLWKFGDDFRARFSALGALAYEWPVAGRLSGAIRLEGLLSKSWFEEGDLPPEYDLRLTWRYGVTLGVRYRI